MKAKGISILNGYWHSYSSGIMSGKKDDGYISIKNIEEMQSYITTKIGNVVSKINIVEKGKQYPYNRNNPYSHDIYYVELTDGKTFNITRIYGRPNWSGNVDYIEQIEVTNH